MKVQWKPSAIRQTRWHEYLLRFALGGLVTVVAGVIAHKYGPIVGGLFLAFPSIFPASVTLVQDHKEDQEKREGEGKEKRRRRSCQAAGVTAAGAALGGAGLVCFAIAVWLFAAQIGAWLTLGAAMLAWIVVNVAAWWGIGPGKLEEWTGY